MGSQGKHSKDPSMKHRDVAISIQVEICPWISNFPSASVPPWKKSNRVRGKAKTKAGVQGFCFMLKLSPLEPTQSIMATCAWARENMLTHQVSALERGEREGEREREFLCSPGIISAWVWNRPGAFLKQTISQACVGLDRSTSRQIPSFPTLD